MFIPCPPGVRTLSRLIEFSPDGERVLIAYEIYPRLVHIHDSHSGLQLCEFELPSPRTSFFHLSWAPDGQRVAAGYTDRTYGKIEIPFWDENGETTILNSIGKVVVWNANTGSVLNQWQYASDDDNSYPVVVFSGDGERLIGKHEPLRLFDSHSGKVITDTLGELDRTSDNATIAANPSKSRIAYNHDEPSRIEIMDVEKNEVTHLRACSQPSFCMQWVNDDLLIFCQRETPTIFEFYLWDARRETFLSSPRIGRVHNAEINPQFPVLALETWEPNEIVIYDYDLQRVTWRHATPRGATHVNWSPDGKKLCAAVMGKVSYSPSLAEPYRFVVFNRYGDIIFEKQHPLSAVLAFSPGSERIAIGFSEGTEVLNLP